MSNECLTCDAYDPDLGCTMPCPDRYYACPLEVNDEEFEEMTSDHFPGQIDIFGNEDDYPY